MHPFPGRSRSPETDLPPSTVLSVDLAGATLPNPELKKTFKFRDAPRGIVPSGESLPQLIGIEHDPEGLRIAETFIASLPKGIRVGVEFDRWQLINAEARTILVSASRSFSAIAATAQRAGHQVVFLERQSFHIPNNGKHLVRAFRQTANDVLSCQSSPDAVWAVRERLYNLSSHFGVGRGCSLFNVARSSAWRSELMARTIARLGGWKPEDVVLVGTAHALNLAKIFDIKITQVIGHYSSQEHLESRLAEVMLAQAASHSTLLRYRAVHKSLFAFKHPLQTWRHKHADNTNKEDHSKGLERNSPC